ncbi:hypothetical protein [Saccharopolyspora phatthalungensis]|uniref:HNH endonuclease n=1 Tax=Saccharopolyspora phatthalungensis TaxID=664693 RepID=A0A840QB84_9PSEU|nr:hypothetical protein [Saccharopolyspora phatthalungensis]MBB5155908.1 hypothetical protein [Saccharopolyspora phatthalungensis]
MTDDERRSFDNLILLCKEHHELVDTKHPDKYSVETLKSWKQDREAPLRAQTGAVSSGEFVQAVQVQRHEDALAELAAVGPNDLPRLTRWLGAALTSLPTNNEADCIAFIRRLQELNWTRESIDWLPVQEDALFVVRVLWSMLQRLDPILDAAAGSTSGYKRTTDFFDGASMSRLIEDEQLHLAFASEVRTSLRSAIQNRAVAAVLLGLIRGHRNSKLSWEEQPGVATFETRWTLPKGQRDPSEVIQFEIFTPTPSFAFRVFAFRAWVTPRTIDLFGATEGHAYPTRLDIELIDPHAWWLVLVPTALRQIVWDAMILHRQGKPYGPALSSMDELTAPRNFHVGLP